MANHPISAPIAVLGLLVALSPLLATFGHQAVAQALPDANTCISVSNAPDGSGSSDNWSPRYRVTNSCSQDISFSWRHNHGLAYEGSIRCSGGSATTVRAGGSKTIGAGPLPRGVTSRISYCSDYADYRDQDASGYKTCAASGLPTCP